jgi:hypothetical protein
LRKLTLVATLLVIMTVIAYPAIASYHDGEEGPPGYDGEYPPGYDDEGYGTADWWVDEVLDSEYNEDTGTWEYEVVGEFGGYPAEFELVCDEEVYSLPDEGSSPYDEGGYSQFDDGSCTPTDDVELL